MAAKAATVFIVENGSVSSKGQRKVENVGSSRKIETEMKRLKNGQ